MRLDQEQKTFAQVQGKTVELLLDNIVTDSLKELTLRFRNHASITYHVNEKKLILQRESFIGQGTEERMCTLDRLQTLHIFLDTSSVEIFVNGGEEVFTARIFPRPEEEEIQFMLMAKFSLT